MQTWAEWMIYRWTVPGFAAWTEARSRTIAICADLAAGQRVLDLGCGDGVLGQMAAAHGASVVYADRSSACLRLVPLVPLPIRRTQVDAWSLPFHDDVFDRVLIGAMLVYIQDWQAVLRETLRVLCPSGRVVIYEPLFERWRHPLFWPLTQVKHYLTEAMLLEAMEGAGFQQVEFLTTCTSEDPIRTAYICIWGEPRHVVDSVV